MLEVPSNTSKKVLRALLSTSTKVLDPSLHVTGVQMRSMNREVNKVKKDTESLTDRGKIWRAMDLCAFGARAQEMKCAVYIRIKMLIK